ncbi:MAG: RluA family pseudouridine synthase [Bacteroidales bacterium]|nr:RluA family pseudouridine synthase [Bacteroidales bacterium]
MGKAPSIADRILFEDNHIIVFQKLPGEISQGDKTGDLSLPDLLKTYIKNKYNKPGNVFLGVVHRIDRPVGGVMVFARTSKALGRLNESVRNGDFRKTYLAVTYKAPEQTEGEIRQYLVKNQKLNKSFLSNEKDAQAKEAILKYKLLASSDRYHLIEVDLLTGRHHQIRVQLASMGCIIKGDLKYNAPRSNPDGSISLYAYKLDLVHPVSKEKMQFTAKLPKEEPWLSLSKSLNE